MCYPRDDPARRVVRDLGPAFLYLSIYLARARGRHSPFCCCVSVSLFDVLHENLVSRPPPPTHPPTLIGIPASRLLLSFPWFRARCANIPPLNSRFARERRLVQRVASRVCMAEPTEEEFPAEPAEGEVTAVDEEMLQPEEEPVATGAPPVPKTDEEVLTGVYHHLANFYGGVDAAIVNEMLTAPTKCAFLRIVGPAAVAGRLMGGKAAKAAAAKLLASKHGKAAELPVRYFIRFVKPLPRLNSSYCGIVSYNFREQSACDAFLQQYASQVLHSSTPPHCTHAPHVCTLCACSSNTPQRFIPISCAGRRLHLRCGDRRVQSDKAAQGGRQGGRGEQCTLTTRSLRGVGLR